MSSPATNFYYANSLLDQRNYNNSAAVSAASEKLKEDLGQVVAHQVNSIHGEKLQQVQEDLYEIWQEAGIDNWDGEGGKAVNADSVQAAMRFLRALPLISIEVPLVGADRHGFISLDWENDEQDSLTIVIRGARIVYAALYADGEESHGIAGFKGKMPESVMKHIMSIASQ